MALAQQVIVVAFKWHSGRTTWPRLRTEVHAAALSEQVVTYTNGAGGRHVLEAAADEKARLIWRSCFGV